MAQFRYVKNGGRELQDLTAEERDTQLRYLLRKTRTALEHIVAQAEDARALNPDTNSIFVDASFTFALPGVETVYADISVLACQGNSLTVTVGVRQLQAQGGGTHTYSSLVTHHIKEFTELFVSLHPDYYVVREDGSDSYIVFLL